MTRGRRVLAGLAAGFALLTALRLPTGPAASGEEPALTAREATLRARREELLGRIRAMEQRLDAARGDTRAEEDLELRLEWERVAMASGLTDMRGPGVEVTLDDAPREAGEARTNPNLLIVHDVDVLRVINLLRAAGAECLAINGERLTSTSRIRCGGPTIRVRDRPLAPPFVIRAIGDPDALYAALTVPAEEGGMAEAELLRAFAIPVSIRMREELSVPKVMGAFSYTYATAGEG